MIPAFFLPKITELPLIHRRLSIIDLSSTGHQPITSYDGRYVLSYNGEVYNYRELKHELEGLGIVFKGSSDAEREGNLCLITGLPSFP